MTTNQAASKAPLTPQAYLELIKDRMESLFDFKDTTSQGIPLQLNAELNCSEEHYLLVKRFKIYTINTDEYLYLQGFEQELTLPMVQQYVEWVKGKMQALKPRQDHMSSVFIMILTSTKPFTPQVQAYLEGCKYRKDYMLTFKGWSNLSLIGVDLSTGNVIANNFGKKSINNFKF